METTTYYSRSRVYIGVMKQKLEGDLECEFSRICVRLELCFSGRPGAQQILDPKP